MCDGSLAELLKGEYACLLANHMIVTGNNTFTITLYDSNTNQVFYEQKSHFIVDDNNDMRGGGNNVWEWNLSPTKVILAGSSISIFGLASVVAVKSFQRRFDVPKLADILTIFSPSSGGSPPPPRSPPKFRPALPSKAREYFPLRPSRRPSSSSPSPDKKNQLSRIIWNVSNLLLFAAGLALIQRRIASEAFPTNTIPSLPIPTVSVPYFNDNDSKGGKSSSSKNKPLFPALIDLKVLQLITLPDGTRVAKSSIWWVECVATSFIAIFSGHPRFLQKIEKFLVPQKH